MAIKKTVTVKRSIPSLSIPQQHTISKRPLFEKFAPVMLVAIICLAFVSGALWQKVSMLGSGNTVNIGNQPVADPSNAAPQGPSPLEESALKQYAKDLKLDSGKFDTCLDEGQAAADVKKEYDLGGSVGVNGTPAFFVNGHLISGAQPYQIFKDAIEYELKKGDWASAPTNLATVGKEKVNVDISNSPKKGKDNAPVTLVEFSDFECPFCMSFYKNTLPSIIKDYVDSGKVLLVYKPFPLSFHPNAQKSAEAATCAFKQGKFWEMHDKLFSVQS